MATTKSTPPPDEPDNPPADTAGSTLAPGTTRKMKERADREKKDYKLSDDYAFRKATEGVPDQETLDAVLALGGDASRSSPVREQVLPDADPGLTTTTGAHRTPIDPTTAAVPASEDSDLARSIRGTPTVGSGRQHGKGEERWKGTNAPGERIKRLKDLKSKDDMNNADLYPATTPSSDEPAAA